MVEPRGTGPAPSRKTPRASATLQLRKLDRWARAGASCSRHAARCLDALGEEVARLLDVRRRRERRQEVGEHREAAVLNLLQLLLGELLGRVLEAERVEAAAAEGRDVGEALAEAEVAGDVVVALLDDLADAAALEERREREDLPVRLRRHAAD